MPIGQNKIRKLSRILVRGVLVAAVLATVAAFYLFRANDLGLTGFDAMMGGFPNMTVLRANTRSAADSFLAQHKDELAAGSDLNELTVDYSQVAKVRKLGYRSSFYYYCWDVYLPYSLRTRSGKPTTVLVHLSDGVPEYKHDMQKFRVLDVRLLDDRGGTIKAVDPT